MVGTNSEYTPFVNNTLVRIHDVERVALFSINRLAGLTAFCLAVRD